MSIELVFAEIGDHSLPVDRDHFLKYFPEASVLIIRDGECIGDHSHPRWGWRMNDYHKVKGLLDSTADVAISFDADMRIVSEEVRHIIGLAQTFGLCMPANPRKMVKVDNEVGVDAQIKIDNEMNPMYAVNCGIIALDKHNERAVKCVKDFLFNMKNLPMRGPLAWAGAFWQTGFFPCLLPPQWCVCAEDVGIGNEIVLHTGHSKVKDAYGY